MRDAESLWVILGLTYSAILSPLTCHGAEFSTNTFGEFSQISLTGEIVHGDAEKFR
jgi:hypothetical protein